MHIVAYCIFDMTPYESFLLIKNESSNLKQLLLVTLLLMQYLYLYLYIYLYLSISISIYLSIYLLQSRYKYNVRFFKKIIEKHIFLLSRYFLTISVASYIYIYNIG